MNAVVHYPFCVYTIVSRDVLDTVALERRPLIQTERKTWAKAKFYLKEASAEGSRVPVILGDAKDCSKLLYWGLLMGVEIKQSSTEYEVDQLRPIRDGHTPQELILAASGENISPGFIRPYALCHTPAFLTESTASAFLSPEEGESPETYLEGAAIRVSVNAYERNAKARQKCIEHYGSACAACGFDFEGTYGEIGRGFIHVHHVKPLSEIGAQYEVNPIQDLRPVCPNCHAMLHTQSPAMSIEELNVLIKQ
ncbi:MAG: HNH endonuclease [Thiobacillus sp.]|nr:HNH endonuclease [Thiobacillus sp.]